jgi:hypothetical protein
MGDCLFIALPFGLPFGRAADFGLARAAFFLALGERFGCAACFERFDFGFALVATIGHLRARRTVFSSAKKFDVSHTGSARGLCDASSRSSRIASVKFRTPCSVGLYDEPATLAG